MDSAHVEVTVFQLSDGNYEYHYSEGAQGTNPPGIDFVDGDGNLYLDDFKKNELEIRYSMNSKVNGITFAKSKPVYLEEKKKTCRGESNSPQAFNSSSFTASMDAGDLILHRSDGNKAKNFCYALRFDVVGLDKPIQDDPEIKNGGTRDSLIKPFLNLQALLIAIGALIVGLFAGRMFFGSRN